MKKCVFLDRDGTIIKDSNFVYMLEHLEFLPKAIDGLKEMRKKGYLLIIITNQSGIGRGYFEEKDYFVFMKHMYSELIKKGVDIERDYFCPHLPEDNCSCRKPKELMVNLAKKDFDIDLKKSYFIGDKDIDILTGKNCGCKTILIESDKKIKDAKPDYSCKNLLDASKIIL
jgi:D-glycero-D-manno-heptose 1,7-bisphosphate phosphatase